MRFIVYHRAGIDEVGYGSWAGPLVIGAVIIPQDLGEEWNEITDSKRLTPQKRVQLAQFIYENAVWATTVWAMADEISERGLGFCHKGYISNLCKIIQSSWPHMSIAVDGTWAPEGSQSIVKGDSKEVSIGAASIIAKVERDAYMQEQAKLYPEYSFDRNKGYGTKAHRLALDVYGTTPLHRRGYQIKGYGTL